jgi:hypothetical protein
MELRLWLLAKVVQLENINMKIGLNTEVNIFYKWKQDYTEENGIQFFFRVFPELNIYISNYTGYKEIRWDVKFLIFNISYVKTIIKNWRYQ